jgi:hypothetical protein
VCDLARQRRFALRNATQELRDPLRRLALQQVAGRPGPDRREQVLLGSRCRQDDDLRLRRCLADARQRL